MLRSTNNDNSVDNGLGLGPHLVGKQMEVNGRNVSICKQLGEGGFSFVYLVRDKDGGGNDRDRDRDLSASRGGDRDGDDPTPNSPQHQQQQQSSQQQSATSHPNAFKHSSNGNNSAPGKNSLQHSKQRQLPSPPYGTPMVLKITSVHSKAQRQMAEKEAKLLQQLSHPSIILVYDHGFRDPNLPMGTSGANNSDDPNGATTLSSSNSSGNIHNGSITNNNNNANNQNSNGQLSSSSSSKPTQHLILMEYCEGGTAFDAIRRMRSSFPSPLTSLSLSTPSTTMMNPSQRFDLPSLVISFGQICNAVSYLHAQRPPIIHRDLKPVNFLIKNGAYKICDFGSAVLGHTDLRTPENRRKAEEVVQKTTTQMFRAPEMVDLYMAKKLTKSTDVWALGCCLYSLAFLRDCFEEGSNLAILSRKYKIPDDNPYGEGLVDLIDRMLTVDYKERADMSEVIMCLSALYSNRPLPKRKKRALKPKEESKKEETRVGAYRTDGQGIRQPTPEKQVKKSVEAKKLNPNSAAAKRKKASLVQKQKETVPSSQIPTSDSANSSFQDYGGVEGNEKASNSAQISDGHFGKFASFEQAFENSFDPFDDGNCNDGQVFPVSSAFDEQCRISNASSQSGSDFGEGAVGAGAFSTVGSDAFEVTFQGFGSGPSTFSAPGTNHNKDDLFDRNGDDIFGSTNSKTPSALPSLSSSGLQDDKETISGKKKRGLFGMLGKR